MRGARVAEVGVQGIADRLVVDARRLGDRCGHARECRRHAEVRDVLGRHLGGLQAPLDHRRHDRHVARIADPALLPLVVELVVDGAEVVDEIGRARGLAQQPGDRVALPHHNGGGAIAARHLERARGLGVALLGGDHQRLGVAPQRLDQGRRGRALGGGDIDRRHVLAQAQRLGDDARMQPVEEREGGRGKPQGADTRAVAPGEGIAGGLDRHRHGILVPVAEGALALGLALERRVEPAVRVGNRLARQPAPGDVGAERENALGHHRP